MKRWYALLGVLVYLYVRLILIALSIRSGYRKCKQVKRGPAENEWIGLPSIPLTLTVCLRGKKVNSPLAPPLLKEREGAWGEFSPLQRVFY